MIQTVQKFEKVDLDEILGMPIIELDKEFRSFSTNDLGFSIGKRTRIISKTNKDCYYFNLISEEINNSCFTGDELIEKLNYGERQYRLATPNECRYIAMKRFDWLNETVIYEKMN